METLDVGRFVKIKGLASEKARKHNGKTAVVKTPLDESSGRWGVVPVGEETKRVLSIKPSNLTILCSCCKMREEQTIPTHIKCERCAKESYCSLTCKERHWEGMNTESDVPNCHKAWCIPMHFEMEPPAQPIGQGNVGDRAYEEVVRYLHLSRDIGGSGRRNEEKAMLEKLITVDPNQPSAYNNLYVSCSELAVMAERYRPEEYEQLAFMAIHYLYRAILNTVSETLPDGRRKAPDSPRVEMLQALVYTINHNALSFIEACMRGQRGKVNARLENIERCFQAMVVLFDQCNESTAYKVHGHFGFCLQKLMKYDDAVRWFTSCNDHANDDKFWLHTSLMQIPQCLSSVALYSDDKSPAERAEIMETAITKFNEAITIMKEGDGDGRGIPSYRCQAQLCRCLFNANSLLNQFALSNSVEYPRQKKDELMTLLNGTVNAAMQGAVAAGDRQEIQALESLQQLPFM